MRDTTHGLVARASALTDLHRAEDAVALLQRAVAEAPEHRRAWCELARAELSRNRPEEAMRAANRAVALAPEDEWPHRLASLALGRTGRADEAVRAAREAVRLAPHTWQAHLRLAEALSAQPAVGLHRRKPRREAGQVARRAVELAPLEPDPHTTVGHLLLRENKFRQADAAFREALRLDPENTRARNGLGLGQLRRGRVVAAAGEFGAAVAVDPSDQIARRNISAAAWNSTRKVIIALLIVSFALIQTQKYGSAAPIARIVAATLALAIPVGYLYAWRRAPTAMHGYLLRLPRQEPLLGATLLCCAWAAALLAACAFAPTGRLRVSLAVFAFMAVIGALLVRRVGLDRHNRAVGAGARKRGSRPI